MTTQSTSGAANTLCMDQTDDTADSSASTTVGASTSTATTASGAPSQVPLSETSAEPQPASSTTTPAATATAATAPPVQQLDKAILDKFAASMLPGLMQILNNVPDTVYRVCELIVVVVRKYGEQWRDQA